MWPPHAHNLNPKSFSMVSSYQLRSICAFKRVLPTYGYQVQKTRFDFYLKHQSESSTMGLTCADRVELHKWYYHHRWGRIDTCAKSDKDRLKNLLACISSIRNEDAHRHKVTSDTLYTYAELTVNILRILDEPKSIHDVSIAERYIHTCRASARNRIFEGYESDIDWDEVGPLQSLRYKFSS